MAAGGAVNSSERRRGIAVVAAGFAAALAIRLALLAKLAPNPDLASFEIVVAIVRRGGDVYAETGRYNYSPLWAYVLTGLDFVARSLGITLARAVTSLLLVADAATAWVLYRILRTRGRDALPAALGALLFFANPVSVVASSVRGMFDDVAILFLVVAVAVDAAGRTAASTAALSLSLLVKHVAWFHPLLWWKRGRGAAGMAAALVPYAVFLASFLPWWNSRAFVKSHVFQYRSLDEAYGTEPLRMISWLPHWTQDAVFVVAALAAVVWLLRRGVETGRASLFLFLVVLAFAPGVTPYYFVWPVALGALYPSAGYFAYTAAVSLFYLRTPDLLGVEWAHLPGWGGVWFATVLWALWEIRALTLRPAVERSSGK
jgi:hypothetical protein